MISFRRSFPHSEYVTYFLSLYSENPFSENGIYTIALIIGSGFHSWTSTLWIIRRDPMIKGRDNKRIIVRNFFIELGKIILMGSVTIIVFNAIKYTKKLQFSLKPLS
ncbi:MAG: hypothetical protein Q8K26_05150 [Candidatus Gracilibacteria bacterium]|nr:hypothetical protein [Candidatus Gracilibacteria bacterium]